MVKARKLQSAELVAMNWDETSGVDHSANEEEGWLVMKNAGEADAAFGAELAELLDEDDELDESETALVTAVEAVDFSDAPAPVKSAVKVLMKHLQGVSHEGAPNTGVSRDEMRGLLKRLLEWGRGKQEEPETDFIKALQDNWPEFVKKIYVLAQGGGTPEDKSKAFIDAVSVLQAAVVKGA